jgi:hypothetical protein
MGRFGATLLRRICISSTEASPLTFGTAVEVQALQNSNVPALCGERYAATSARRELRFG